MYIIQLKYKGNDKWLRSFNPLTDFNSIDEQFTRLIKYLVTSQHSIQAARLVRTSDPPDYIVREVLRYQEFKEV
jgi:hypothetical protein